MKRLMILILSLPLYVHAGFGGGYSRGGGGSSRSYSSGSSSRSYSAPSRSYSRPSFGGSYARPSYTPPSRPSSSFGGSYSTPKAPIVRPTPSYTPPAPTRPTYSPPTHHSTEHHYYGGGSSGGGFFNGYLMGSLMNSYPGRHSTTTVVQQAPVVSESGQVITPEPVYVQEPRRVSVWGILFDLAIVALIVWAIVIVWRKIL